ncbi:polyketide cyclase [Chitinophaga alhagiae]|uniref:Polyketide cyclase n=1 Tax=Chitinophaga alhagiae TaxID=2203219 RepID=A0ABN5LT19_9BACT|nr:SRPBCC family protein [Chitinophaga alhagiae]AWO02059.1 polyketide cyclase [Chitinophaga alhagiae]
METKKRTEITIEALVQAPIEKVWQYFNEPEHIMQWAFASEDWHAPASSNDLRPGGKFSTTMAAKDGSFSFDFGGVYSDVQKHQRIAYEMSDGRKVKVTFAPEGGGIKVVQAFEAEDENPVEMQREGWQTILNNFKKHTETK